MAGGRKQPSIPQVFQGQSILVTGATGFVGKALLEKLLRCCPGLGRIYLIVRPKKGDSLRQRMKHLLEQPFFDRCRSERGAVNWCCGSAEVAAMEDDMKGPLVVGISGDVSEKGLGLDDKDRTHLELHVTYVFHSAATVRFNEPLRQAVFLNTRGTREMLELASRMTLLKAFVHVSTVYAHVSNHSTTIEEKFYSVPMEPEDVIKAAEEMEDEEYDEISRKLAEEYHNTYLCTKALAERIIEKDYSHLPISIYRPGIVGGVLSSPIPGWTERNQGPGIVISSCACGLFGCICCFGDVKPEIIPVDHVVNAMMVIVWALIIGRTNKAVNGLRREIQIFNHVSSNHCDFTWSTFKVHANKALQLCQETDWMGSLVFTSSYTVYQSSAYARYYYGKLLDAMCHMRGIKSDISGIQLRAKNGLDSLWYFMVTQFKFADPELRNLRERFIKEAGANGSGYDLSEFDFDIKAVKWNDYIQCYVDHIRRDLLKFYPDKLRSSLKNSWRFKILLRSLQVVGIILLSVCLYYLLSSFGWMNKTIEDVHDSRT